MPAADGAGAGAELDAELPGGQQSCGGAVAGDAGGAGDGPRLAGREQASAAAVDAAAGDEPGPLPLVHGGDGGAEPGSGFGGGEVSGGGQPGAVAGCPASLRVGT